MVAVFLIFSQLSYDFLVHVLTSFFFASIFFISFLIIFSFPRIFLRLSPGYFLHFVTFLSFLLLDLTIYFNSFIICFKFLRNIHSSFLYPLLFTLYSCLIFVFLFFLKFASFRLLRLISDLIRSFCFSFILSFFFGYGFYFYFKHLEISKCNS